MRWSTRLSKAIETPAIDAFLAEVAEVSRRHGLAIGHEDGHGSFQVERYCQDNIDWLMHAHDATDDRGRGEE